LKPDVFKLWVNLYSPTSRATICSTCCADSALPGARDARLSMGKQSEEEEEEDQEAYVERYRYQRGCFDLSAVAGDEE
jgi:hypothetical protein